MNPTALRLLHWACRLVLAGTFLYSGYIKIREPLQFAASLMGYQLLPAAWIYPIADFFPWAEVILGLVLLSGLKIRYSALAAAGLLVFFLGILAITYARGIEADCGCFGSGEPISPKTLVRDSLFLIPALFLAFAHRCGAKAGAGSGRSIAV